MKENEFPEKAYKNLEFLNSREARTLRILSEYDNLLSCYVCFICQSDGLPIPRDEEPLG